MRVIYCTVGMPASGKSTFLKHSPLKDYVVATDELRKLVSTPQINYTPDTDAITIGLNNDINKKVWDMTYTLVEDRMKNGETIAVDATFLFKSPFSTIKKLCKLYNYRLITIDFINTGLTFEQLLDRNNNIDRVQEHKDVSYDTMKKFWNRQQNITVPNNWNMIKPEELEQSLAWHCSNVDNYKQVIVIGDIHSSYTVLTAALKDNDPIDNPDKLYVFLGDYLDRGTKPAETFKWLYERKDLPNMVLLRGNHEYHLEHHYQGLPVTNSGSRKETIPALYKAGITKEDIHKFVRKLQDVYYIEYHGQKYLFSHAGVPTTPEFLKTTTGIPLFVDTKIGLEEINLLDESVFTKGIGGFKINLEQYNHDYNNGVDYPIQIHGHRNVQLNKAKWDNTINLEQQVDTGGNLAMVVLTGDKHEIKLVKNKDFDYAYATDKANIDLNSLSNEQIKDIMERTDGIRQKRDASGLTANNFTPEVFYGDTFNKFSVTARGLFTDGKGNVQLRGFNKFFVLDQRPETELGTVLKNAKYPAVAAKKYDGHLSLLGWYDGKPRMFTKSGSTELAKVDWHNFSRYLHDIDRYTFMEDWLKLHQNKTVLMESLNAAEDVHLVDTNDKAGFRLLEVIENKYEPTSGRNFVDTNLLTALLGETDKCYFKMAERYEIANDRELMELINSSKQTNLNLPDTGYYRGINPTTFEGWVLTFADGFKVKVKNAYFLAIKEVRSKLEVALDNPMYYSDATNWYNLIERSYNVQSKKLLKAVTNSVTNGGLIEIGKHRDKLNNLDLTKALKAIGLNHDKIVEIISD